MSTHSGLSRAPRVGAPTIEDCRATSGNSRDANSQSEKCDFIRLWGAFPFAGDFLLFCSALSHGTTTTWLTTVAAMRTRKVRSKSS